MLTKITLITTTFMFKVFPRQMCLRLHQFAPTNRVAASLQVYMPSTISILSEQCPDNTILDIWRV